MVELGSSKPLLHHLPLEIAVLCYVEFFCPSPCILFVWALSILYECIEFFGNSSVVLCRILLSQSMHSFCMGSKHSFMSAYSSSSC